MPPDNSFRIDGKKEWSFGPTSADVGKWTDWVFHVNWNFNVGGGGYLQVWKDGVLVVDTTGPNCYSERRSTTMKSRSRGPVQATRTWHHLSA
jgi:hypothetical protein